MFKKFFSVLRISEIVVFLFLIITFINPFSQIQDHLVMGGWVYMSLLLVILSLFFCLGTQGRLLVPKFKLNSFLSIGISVFVFLIFTSIINKASFLELGWMQRWMFVLMAFLFFQLVKSTNDFNTIFRRPLIVFIIAVCAESIYQYFFICKKNDALGMSCFSSRFWNINMLAQMLLASFPIVDYFQIQNIRISSKRYLDYFYSFVKMIVTLIILFSICRSSILGLFIYYVLQFFYKFSVVNNIKTVSGKWVYLLRDFAVLALSISLFVIMNFSKEIDSNFKNNDKIHSANYRLTMWKGSLDVAKENPFGIGINNFEFGYIPYKIYTVLPGDPNEVDKVPHSEPIRFLTEEGWFGFAAIVFLALYLLANCFRFFFKQLTFQFSKASDFEIKIQKNESENLDFQFLFFSFIACMLPEWLFQFPSEMWYPTFVFSLVLSQYLRVGCDVSVLRLRPLKSGLVALTIVVAGFWLLRALPVMPLSFSKTYCAYFHDNWKMCNLYFREHISELDTYKARQVLRPVLRRQPFNFVVLQNAFLISDTKTQKIISCNYWNLFLGKYSIPGSHVNQCVLSSSPQELRKSFEDFPRQW